MTWLKYLVKFPSKKLPSILFFHSHNKIVDSFFSYFCLHILGPFVMEEKILIFLSGQDWEFQPLIKKNKVWTKFIFCSRLEKITITNKVAMFKCKYLSQKKEKLYLEMIEKLKEKEVANMFLTYIWNYDDEVDLEEVPHTSQPEISDADLVLFIGSINWEKKIEKQQMYRSYCDWCEDHKKKQKEKKVFHNSLLETGMIDLKLVKGYPHYQKLV